MKPWRSIGGVLKNMIDKQEYYLEKRLKEYRLNEGVPKSWSTGQITTYTV